MIFSGLFSLTLTLFFPCLHRRDLSSEIPSYRLTCNSLRGEPRLIETIYKYMRIISVKSHIGLFLDTYIGCYKMKDVTKEDYGNDHGPIDDNSPHKARVSCKISKDGVSLTVSVTTNCFPDID